MSPFLDETLKKYRVIFYILIAAATYFALTPLPVPAPDVPSWDKINHTAAFAVLTYFALKGFSVRFRSVFILLTAYGIAIECIQYFIPNRHFSLLDIVADLLGIILVLVAVRIRK